MAEVRIEKQVCLVAEAQFLQTRNKNKPDNNKTCYITSVHPRSEFTYIVCVHTCTYKHRHTSCACTLVHINTDTHRFPLPPHLDRAQFLGCPCLR